MKIGQHTLREILTQPEAWSAALNFLDENSLHVLDLAPTRRFDSIVFTGCGSTYYLALAVASLTQELIGLPTHALPASELWLSPRSSYANGSILLVAISRSGETSETLRACAGFLAGRRGELVTLSCVGEAQLSRMGGLNLVFPSGQEKSVAQTRAFSTLYLAAAGLAMLWAGRLDLYDALVSLPEAGARLLKEYAPLAGTLARDASLERFYWLGSAGRYGIACELSLKMKEMSLSHSEPFHFLEFRHGPISMVNASTLVVGLRSTSNGHREAEVLEDIRKLGGRILDIGEAGEHVRFDAGLAEPIQNVLYLPVGQLIAYERALSKGLNPDHPTNLQSVVRL